MNFSKKINTFFSLGIFSLILSSNSEAVLIPVGPPPNSIQAAIDLATNGDTVVLSAGTYIEEIKVINKSIDIIGMGKDLSIIQSPNALTHLSNNFNYSGSNYWCIITVDNQAAPSPQTVNISNLTVNGSNQQDTIIAPIYGSTDRFFAIGYHNAAGTVDNVHTTSTRQYSNFNELAGGGIVNASNNGSVAFTVSNSLIDFYQRIGIDCRGNTLTATITDSTVDRGYVLTSGITATPNGIQFSGGTIGSITNNVVENNIATVAAASASAIIPFGGGANILISGNTVNNNDLGIAAISNGNNLVISDNTFNFTTTPGINPVEGIAVQDTIGLTTISGNVMNQIPNIDMDLSSSTDQPFQLMNNQFIGSQTGLLVTGNITAGPQITMNSDSFLGTNVYYIQEVASPNDIWPTTASVSFDGLLVEDMTTAQYQYLLSKIYDYHNDPALGLVVP